MSERGPGWWLAADGRWYPPHAHPDADHRTTFVAKASEADTMVDLDPIPTMPDDGPATEPFVAPELASSGLENSGLGEAGHIDPTSTVDAIVEDEETFAAELDTAPIPSIPPGPPSPPPQARPDPPPAQVLPPPPPGAVGPPGLSPQVPVPPVPHPPSAWPAAAAPVSTRPTGNTGAAVVSSLASVLACAGAFLTWIKIAGPGTAERSGWHLGADGRLVLIAGLVAGAIAGACWVGVRHVLLKLLLLAGAATLLAIFVVDLLEVLDVRDQLPDSDVTVGIGLWLVGGAGALLVAGAVLERSRLRRRS